jgi:hypothetical protein
MKAWAIESAAIASIEVARVGTGRVAGTGRETQPVSARAVVSDIVTRDG